MITVITKLQFGLVKGKSTVGAIDSLVKFVLSAYKNKEQQSLSDVAQATFCDLSKAFDCVEHDILLVSLIWY